MEISNSIELPSPCGRGQRGGLTFLVIYHPLLNPLLYESKTIKGEETV